MAGDLGFVLAALALAAIGCFIFLVKKVVRRLGGFMCLFLSHAVSVLALLVISIISLSWKMPKDMTSAVLIVMSLLAVTGLYLFYRSLDIGNASVISVSVASMVLWSAVLSWVLFGISPSLINFVAVPVLVVGVLLSVVSRFRFPKRLDWGAIEAFFRGESVEKASLSAVVAGCFFAMYRLAFYFTSKDIGTHRTFVYSSVIILVLLLFPLLGRSLKELLPKPSADDWRWLGPALGCYLIGVVSVFYALTSLKIDALLSFVIAFPVITVLLSLFIHKERFRLWQYFGFMLSVIGFVAILL